MARLSIIIIFVIWLSWVPTGEPEARVSVRDILYVFGGLALGILSVAIYSRIMARRLKSATLYRDMLRFNRVLRIARLAIPVWFAILVFLCDFPLFVQSLLVPLRGVGMESPGFLLGTLPPFLAMIALWWATHPADCALREQNLLYQLSLNLPVRRSPTMGQYLVANVRMQLLFMYTPVLLILVLRDLFLLGAVRSGFALGEGSNLIISLLAMLPVMLLSPVLLVRILPTMRLPDSPLRLRLEELGRQHGLRVSNVLLWKTGGNIGNAAVMGIVPRLRYLLITDLLLETMSDEQIIAVFAHEIGHVAHRHLLWMGACVLGIMFLIGGPIESLMRVFDSFFSISEHYATLIALAITAPLFFVIFGMFVRRLERQADVFAARTMPELAAAGVSIPCAAGAGSVSNHGAQIVGSALRRIATINNVPVHAHEWLHGSIGSRIEFLRTLSGDPQHTRDFDKRMRWLYFGLLAMVASMGSWTFYNMLTMPAL